MKHYSLVATKNTVEWYGIGTCVAIGISMNTIATRQLSVSRTLEIDFRHRRNHKRVVAKDSSLLRVVKFKHLIDFLSKGFSMSKSMYLLRDSSGVLLLKHYNTQRRPISIGFITHQK